MDKAGVFVRFKARLREQLESAVASQLIQSGGVEGGEVLPPALDETQGKAAEA
jgi:hypothetical protein